MSIFVVLIAMLAQLGCGPRLKTESMEEVFYYSPILKVVNSSLAVAKNPQFSRVPLFELEAQNRRHQRKIYCLSYDYFNSSLILISDHCHSGLYSNVIEERTVKNFKFDTEGASILLYGEGLNWERKKMLPFNIYSRE